jgi:small subunit ribosomal protein S10
MQIARIRLSGTDMKVLDDLCKQIKEIGEKYGAPVAGPIPLPTKKLKITTLKTPCGDGTGHGNATWDRWEMRVHKRIIDIGTNERALRQIMRIQMPENVQIQIELKD